MAGGFAAATTPLAACGSPGRLGASPPLGTDVVLEFASGMARSHTNNVGVWKFIERLEHNAPWIHVHFRGGPDIVSPTLLIEAVESGIFDMAQLPADYYVEQIPGMEMARFTPYTPMDERETGLAELWDQLHHEALGLTYLGRSIAGMPQVFLLMHPLTGLDMSGWSIRSSAATSPLISQLGGTPVSLPLSETFTALERGVVQGSNMASIGPTSVGIDDVVNYALSPRFYDSIGNFVVSPHTWARLDARTRSVLRDTAAEIEPEIFDFHVTESLEETLIWQEKGMQHHTLDEADAEEFLHLAYHRIWDSLPWQRMERQTPTAARIRDQIRDGWDEHDLSRCVPGGAFIGIEEGPISDE
ncbi:hypothetical protein GCM10010467_10380 [Actinocorallia glomerata]|uniref:TRAP transporter substrate-binding protein n=3 Tax=Actinomycetota TaxID=201174 RepID=A0ABP6LVH1_9MICC